MDRKKVPFFLFAAPVGDFIADMSLTAMKTIGKLSLLIVENTGRTGREHLTGRLAEQGILGPDVELVGLDGGPGVDDCLRLVDRCAADGKPFGMMADSGICCLIDPGLAVVRHVIDKHDDTVEIIPVGSSSALDAAIMVCGVDCTNFVFMGHFPETHFWFRDIVEWKIPGIIYVRGDSLKEFWHAARQQWGEDSRLNVTVIRGIRSRTQYARARFRLFQPSSCLDMLLAEPDGEACNQNNFVAVVHRLWDPLDADPR